MILPISKAFQSLKLRLECISVSQNEMTLHPKTNARDLFGDDPDTDNKIKLEDYLKCFDSSLAEIQEFYRKKQEALNNRQGGNYN